MRIDNLSYSRAGGYTTRVHGFTLTHTRDCAVARGEVPDADWLTGCDCYISRITAAEFPDGTTTLIPEDYSTGNEAHIRWLRDELVRKSAARAVDARTITGLIILSIAGWALSLARGIWGF
jgi:hypothetical protein